MNDNRLKQRIICTLSLGHSNKIYLHGRVFPVSQTLLLFSLSLSLFFLHILHLLFTPAIIPLWKPDSNRLQNLFAHLIKTYSGTD